jgi:hypothetical protein
MISMLQQDNELVRNSANQKVCATIKIRIKTLNKAMTTAICSSKNSFKDN